MSEKNESKNTVDYTLISYTFRDRAVSESSDSSRWNQFSQLFDTVRTFITAGVDTNQIILVGDRLEASRFFDRLKGDDIIILDCQDISYTVTGDYIRAKRLASQEIDKIRTEFLPVQDDTSKYRSIDKRTNVKSGGRTRKVLADIASLFDDDEAQTA
jgi:hypothetical protein